MAVGVIVIAIFVGTRVTWSSSTSGKPTPTYKHHLAKALLLGLNFLVAADIVRTVSLAPTLHSMAILGSVIRTFLGRALVVELEGRWPWDLGPELHGLHLEKGRLTWMNSSRVTWENLGGRVRMR